MTSQDPLNGPGPEGAVPAAGVAAADALEGDGGGGQDAGAAKADAVGAAGADVIEPAGTADLGPGKDAFVEADVAPALGLAGAATTANGAEAEPNVMDGALAGAVAPVQESMSVQPAEDVGEAGNVVPAAEPNLPDLRASSGRATGAEPALDEAERAGILF